MKKFTDYQREFKRLGYTFQLNIMNDVVECNRDRLTDPLALTIESQMVDRGFTSSAGIRRSLTRIAFENQYHPIIEWWDSHPWDGVDHFGHLMSHITFQHQTISELFIWKFLLGSVGKVKDNLQNFFLIMDGIQGVGKSSLIKFTIPVPYRRYFVEGGLDPNSKDTKIRIIQNLLWEVGELQGITRKADLESLKNVITQERITARPAYARYDIDKPVICSFWGSVNESGAGFLNDITGNRRFVVVKVLDIDWNYTSVDVMGLWAQLNAAYLAGERGTLTHGEQKEQITINEEYQTISHVEQVLFREYEIDVDKYKIDWIPIQTIMETLELAGLSKGHQRLNMMELAGILSSKGCPKSRKHTMTGCGRATCYAGLKQKTVINQASGFHP